MRFIYVKQGSNVKLKYNYLEVISFEKETKFQKKIHKLMFLLWIPIICLFVWNLYLSEKFGRGDYIFTICHVCVSSFRFWSCRKNTKNTHRTALHCIVTFL